MPHPIGIVTYEHTVHAWALDLPGAIAGAPTVAALDEPLRLTIAEHVAWLRAHGEHLPPSTSWQIAETIDGRALASTGGEFIFAYDQQSLTEDDLETLTARMTWSRDDLLATIADLPDELLDWAPPPSAIASFDAWAPDVRTIRDIVTHVLQLESYYRDGLRDGPAAGIFEPVAAPAAERAITLDRLRALTADDRSRTWRPVRPSRTTPEAWSVRKLARRIISHERAHAAEVRQRLTWILLGLPRTTDHS